MSQPALSDRIATALTSPLPSREIKKLIGKVAEERSALAGQVDAKESRSLDPALDAKAALAEREAAEGLKFGLARMDVAETKLGAALKAAIARESDNEDRLHFEAVRAERDALVGDLEQYRVLARALVALVTRVDRCDQAIEEANRRLPAGEGPLISAEFIARDIPAYLRDSAGPILRLREMTLPAFLRDDAMRPYMWDARLSPESRNPG